MTYESLAVPPPLAPFVDAIWSFEGELAHDYERILPTGAMQLLVNLDEDELRSYALHDRASAETRRGSAICGAHAEPFVIDTAEQRRIVGVSFRPGGAAPFFRPTCDAFEGLHVDLRDVWGHDGASLRERLLEVRGSTRDRLVLLASILVERAARPLVADRAIELAIAALERGRPVARVVDALGWSVHRFLRAFTGAVGLTPKRWARVRRFQRTLRALGRARVVDWADLAIEHGYFDQAHLIHEFRELAATTPTAYAPRAAHEWNHVAL